ncbi:MAG: SprT family zinc-dependent metalloprotease [Candidatus Nealsonbacteria bacterium]
MKKQIILQNKRITYALRKSKRARRMRLAVYCDGSVIVTTPFNLQENIAERFIEEKMGWLLSKIDHFKHFKYKHIRRQGRQDYLKYKERAVSLVEERVSYFNKIYDFKYNKINIKNQKTRWGSCSKKGNLNFNYKIALLPQYLADYIIAHELCHLIEFSHSRKFWNFVRKLVPNYPEIRRELKSYK